MPRSFLLPVIFTFFVALVLTLAPMPAEFRHWRPAWAAMILVYWILQYPHYIGIASGWCVGLILDALYDTELGVHALAMSLLAYFTLNIHKRLVNFPVSHQAAWVFVLIGLSQLIVHWLNGFGSPGTRNFTFLLTAMVSALCWPILVWINQIFVGRAEQT